jgi:hypothetical protein
MKLCDKYNVCTASVERKCTVKSSVVTVRPNLRNLGQERLSYMYKIVTLYIEMQTGFQFQIDTAWRKKNGTVLSVRNKSYVLVVHLVGT